MSEKNAATEVMSTLRQAGFEAYLVGGCVRDIALGREPHDYDVTTNATPEQIKDLLDKTIPVGAKFGVVVAMVNGYQIEVATYRADGTYSDGRRPDEVKFSESAKEDVERRDFTMNGLLLDETNKFVDHVGGLKDIEFELIRCIGSPTLRFQEDALRMLRAVRFAATLGFDIEPSTFKGIVANADRIQNISRERIAQELFKLVTAPFPVRGLVPLITSGLFAAIFPDAIWNFRMQLTLMRFERYPTTDPILGLAMLLVDCEDSPGLTESLLDSLKLPSDVRDKVLGAVQSQAMFNFSPRESSASVLRSARKAGVLPTGLDLFEQGVALGIGASREKGCATVGRFRRMTPEEIQPKPLVTGQDLLDMGLKPSRRFSEILFAVETKQLNGDIVTREQALDFVALEVASCLHLS